MALSLGCSLGEAVFCLQQNGKTGSVTPRIESGCTAPSQDPLSYLPRRSRLSSRISFLQYIDAPAGPARGPEAGLHASRGALGYHRSPRRTLEAGPAVSSRRWVSRPAPRGRPTRATQTRCSGGTPRGPHRTRPDRRERRPGRLETPIFHSSMSVGRYRAHVCCPRVPLHGQRDVSSTPRQSDGALEDAIDRNSFVSKCCPKHPPRVQSRI